jgi:hypothetical protein
MCPDIHMNYLETARSCPALFFEELQHLVVSVCAAMSKQTAVRTCLVTTYNPAVCTAGGVETHEVY